MSAPTSPHPDAGAIAAAMAARDGVFQALGMDLIEARRGHAEVRLTLAPTMLNANGVAHGGVIFTLADAAFGFACNSDGRPTVAAHAAISFVAAARPGEVLTATVTRQHRGRTTGVYDGRVTAGDGRLIALFRGHAHEIGAIAAAAPQSGRD
ncbi:MAG: hydroxyphenylacetyl-CoA thioesterase PaaI [Alphaproteobacteria bacterium]|nr:hydroxyphenylacetyl-CoA thioesterase PaaI [Alphaproteobacteria bacterium]